MWQYESKDTTLLFQSIRVRPTRSSIVIFLIRVFEVVVPLQGTSDVTGVVAVSAAEWLHFKINANQKLMQIKYLWSRNAHQILIHFFCR